MQNSGFALYGKEDLRPHLWEMPELEPGGVLLRVLACGICGSDLRQYWHGPSPRYSLPAVLGHEIVGQVEQIGSQVEDFKPGDLATVAPIIPCMNCPACWRGQDNLCERGLVIGVDTAGAMAEYFYAPARLVAAGGLARVPEGVAPEAAAMTEILACCWHGLSQTRLRAGDDVLLIGEGPIGATFVQLLRLLGAARITVTGLNPYRLAIASELGADLALNIKEIDLRHYARENQYQPDMAIIAAPAVDDAAAALEIIRPGGDILFFSGYPHGTLFSLDLYKFHYAEKHIHGSIDATIADFQHALRLQPQVDMQRLITHRFPLERTVEGFQAGRDERVMKVLIESHHAGQQLKI
jgi:L-iditol 2-dehydrogenase